MWVLAFKSKISAKTTLDIKSAEFSLLFIREFSYFFVYCDSNFEGKKIWLSADTELTYQQQQTPRANFFVRGVCCDHISSHSHFEADGNSGDKSDRKRRKRRAAFGSIDGVRTARKRKPPKTLQPCGFRAVWKTKNSGQKCVWPQIWPPTRPQLNNYRGVAQLVARDIWDVEAGSSSLPTPTNNPLKQLVLEDFCIYF